MTFFKKLLIVMLAGVAAGWFLMIVALALWNL